MKGMIGAAACAFLVATGFVALLYAFVYPDPLAEPFVEIDHAEAKARLDAQIVIEIRGNFPKEEILDSLEIHPPVPIGEEDVQVEHIARFPWYEGFQRGKTRATVNPHRERLFDPETSYTVVLKDENLTFETITLPRVVGAHIDSDPQNDFSNVSTSSPIVLAFNEQVVWLEEYLTVEPHAEVTTVAAKSPSGDTQVMVIPDQRWENSTTYTLTLREGIRDVFGHEGVEGFSLDFDTWPQPTVVEAAPMGDGLPINSAVAVEFERPVDRRAVEEAFKIQPSATGSFEWQNDSRLKWIPSQLEYSTTYAVSVGGMAIGGDPLLPSTWGFTTRSQPRLLEVQPTGKSLPLNSPVWVQFDRPVDRATVEEVFRIEPEAAGSFEWEGDRVVTWRPTELEYSTTYAVSVGGKSTDGDPVVSKDWTFATQDPPVFVEIEGSDESPTLLRAVASGGVGDYRYDWSAGESGQEIRVDLWYGEVRPFQVTVSSGDQTASADFLVLGPPSPCPEGWQVITEEVCYKQDALPGPVQVFLTRIDLQDSDLQLRTAPASDFLGLLSPVSRSADERNTLVSTNADFFGAREGGYFSLGPMVSGGNFTYFPGSTGVVFALDGDLQPWVGLGKEFEVAVGPPAGEPRRLQTINGVPARNGLALFNAYWGRQLSLDADGCYGVFAPIDGAANTAYRFSCGAIEDIPLEVGEFVLVGTGEAAEWMKRNIEHPLIFETSFPIASLDFMVGGSHILIQDDEPSELDSHLAGRHPRTVIGIDEEGLLYLIVVDGRSAASIGMTLAELQQYLSQLGLVDAINLDGGGSSTMLIQGSVMNTPSDGRERAVASVVEVAEQQETCWHQFIRCQPEW